MPKLSPEARSLRARIGAYSALAKHGRSAMTAAARAANPSSDAYWLAQVPADLDETERVTRAGDLKKAYFAKLALKSAQARRKS